MASTDAQPPRRAIRLVAVFFGIGLAACATNPEPPQEPDYRLMDEVALTLVGRYSNHAQWQRAGRPEPGPTRMDIDIEPTGEPHRIMVRMRQQTGDEPSRAFMIELTPGAEPGRLDGRFAPRESASGRSCPMRFSVRRDGFVGETSPETCRFGEGADAAGLLKELAHDGSQLVIGDRLITQQTGEPAATDQILRLDRIRTYSGWAGVRDGEGWRLAGSVRLHSGGGNAEPADAAGMDLGIRLELAPFIWREEDPPILRLSAIELDTGRLLGHAWADLDAEQIGLALPELQVGLRRE